MRVALLNSKPTLRASYLLECFGAGVQQHGDTFFWIDDYSDFCTPLASADVAVQVCAANRWHNNSDHGKFRVLVNEELIRLGKNVVTIDTGYVRSQTDYELAQMQAAGQRKCDIFDLDNKATYEAVCRKVYYQAGYNGLKRSAYYGDLSSVDGRRWEQLDTPLRPWRTTGRRVLVIGQTLHGLSTQDLDIYRWLATAMHQLRARTARPIVYRVHPRIAKIRAHGSRIGKDIRALDVALGKLAGFSRSANILLADDLKDCWAVLNFSSNAAVEAIIAGVPVFAGDPICIAWQVASGNFKTVEAPALPARLPWCWQLAYAQWNAAEMRSGECWQHLRPYALLPRLAGPSL